MSGGGGKKNNICRPRQLLGMGGAQKCVNSYPADALADTHTFTHTALAQHAQTLKSTALFQLQLYLNALCGSV